MVSDIDIVRYDAVYGSVSWEEAHQLRSQLPADIRRRLFSEGRYAQEDYVCARTTDHELQQYLDNYFQTDTKRKFMKWRYVEVPKAKLDQHRFCWIEPQELDHNQNVFFHMKPPECRYTETCPWGAEIISPLRIPKEVSNSLGVRVVSRPWALGVELVLSATVKRLFEEHHITGLEYEECEIGTAKQKQNTTDTPAYVARIQPRVYSTAEDFANAGPQCIEHGVITKSIYTFEERSPDFEDADFQIIDRLRVGTHEYRYDGPPWVASSRVVRLLLGEKVKGLKRRTVALNEKFSPVVYLDD